MYKSSDVLAHFKEVSIFLEAATQHATREKKRQYIILVKYATTMGCICIKIMKLYTNT
jgi:hypothetical protein